MKEFRFGLYNSIVAEGIPLVPCQRLPMQIPKAEAPPQNRRSNKNDSGMDERASISTCLTRPRARDRM